MGLWGTDLYLSHRQGVLSRGNIKRLFSEKWLYSETRFVKTPVSPRFNNGGIFVSESSPKSSLEGQSIISEEKGQL